VATGEVHDDLTRMDIRLQRIDEPRKGIVGHSQHEEVTCSRHLARVHDRNAGQEGLGADAGDVAASTARDDVVPGTSQRSADHRTSTSGADDADAQSRRWHDHT
jgi:hypothetical protein